MHESSLSPEFEKFVTMTKAYDLTVGKQQDKERVPTYNDPIRLATNLLKPIYRAFELSVQTNMAFIHKWRESYYPLPKKLITGFYFNICPTCLEVQHPLPVTDREFHASNREKHHCKVIHSTLPPTYREKRIKELSVQLFSELSHSLDLWIPGRKLIQAKQIMCSDAKPGMAIEKYVVETHGYPYNLDEKTLLASSWLRTLFRDGEIEPPLRDLTEFCAYCSGTIGISRINQNGSIKYYGASVIPAET